MNSSQMIKASLLATSLLIAQTVWATDISPAKPIIPNLSASSAVVTAPTAKPVIHNTNPNNALYRQLDELRSQNAILTESLKNLELKNKISNLGSNPAGQLALASGSNGKTLSLSGQVQQVSGSGNNLKAIILLSNGTRVTTQTGTHIYGLGVVKSISLNEVNITSKTQVISLPFVGDTLTTPGSSPGIPEGMPGVMH